MATMLRDCVNADPARVIDLMLAWLARALAPDAAGWLAAEIDRQRAALDERRLAIALGLVRRKVGRADLSLTPEERAAAQRLRVDWQPQTWGTDEAARVALLLVTYRGDAGAFAARVERQCATAEVAEYVAYLKGFAVFPAAPDLHARAREGVRSSMRPVFEAIACNNPYPFDFFDEAAWNQMVVKCVFTGAPIETITGLRERRNPDLLQMLRDLVAERNAASRPLPDSVHRYIAGDG
jgi:hypothetical protein